MDKKPAKTDFTERYYTYVDTFEFELNPTETLTPLVDKLGGLLEMIFGKERTDRGMKEILEPIANPGDTWREDLLTSYYSEFPFTEMLCEVAAYGRYGIFINAENEESEECIEGKLTKMVETASDFFDQCPLDFWLGENRPPELENAILLGRGRWSLDHGKPIEMQALALLGGVSLGRMRNMISGKSAVFHAENGRIPAHEALEWLHDRDAFYPSIWRTARPKPDTNWDEVAQPIEDPIFVPETRDGMVFHPGLVRNNHYTVGAKGDEVRIEKFEEALAYLCQMPTPRWRQPGKGKSPSWSLVTGVSWKRMTMPELTLIARSMEAMTALSS